MRGWPWDGLSAVGGSLAKSGSNRRGCFHFFWLDASAACPEQPSVTNSQARRLGLVAEYSHVRHHDKLGRVRLAGSPVCYAISRFNTHCLKCCGMGSPLRATPSLHLVTLALLARNAKKFSSNPLY